MRINNIKRLVILQLIFLFLFTCDNFSQQTSLDNCAKFKKYAVEKKQQLKREVASFDQPKLLSKQSLLMVIYPEYITYDTSKDKLERACIQLFENLGMERYKTISFGPFQMQLQFIKDVLNQIPEINIKHPVLLSCKRKGYGEMLKNIESLSELSVQWEILLHYEQFFKAINKTEASIQLDQMINRYNSGKSTPAYPTFKKINCARLSYVQWSKIIDAW